MERQAIVIGLGVFGMSVARALAEQGTAVLAVDIDAERVRLAADFAAEAACFDATDAEALSQTMPERRDACLCAIGDGSRDASIISTALLRQMGAPRVIARANTDVHARILTLVGAHRVINPEREFGIRFATQIMHTGIKGEMPLGKGAVITEVEAPPFCHGQTLAELSLPGRFGITVVAVRKADEESIIVPTADLLIDKGDILITVGREGVVRNMMSGEADVD